MTSKSIVKWEAWMNTFQKFLYRSGNVCSMYFARNNYSVRHSNKTRSYCQRCFSSHIVHSPFPTGEIPKLFIHELMLDIVDRFPEATALTCAVTGRSYKYGELQMLSQRFMNSLIKDGFSYKDTIAIAMPNCPEYPIVTMGALAADITVTIMNINYTPGEMYHQLKDSGSVCVVTGIDRLPDILATVTKLEETTRTKQIRKIIVMDIPSPDFVPEGVARFSEAIADHVDHSKTTSNKTTHNDVAVMPYSSGTTGLAKGVCLSQSNIVGCIQQLTLSGLETSGPDGDQDLVLGLLPFYHTYGFLQMCYFLAKGCQIITLPGFRPDVFTHTLEFQKLTMLFVVPPIILFLGDHPAIERDKHLSSLKLVITGADFIDEPLLERLKAKLPPECELGQAYGMTEVSGIATFPTFPIKNFATCGAPAALTEAKVVSVETGETVGPNQTGEVYLRGPQVMLGYNKNPKATAAMLCKEGWLRTGDIGHYDKDDHFYIEGRLKELIKVKGFQVPPAELEGVLRAIPGVMDVCVIGVPDPTSGETPVAYVVKAPGSTLREEQIIKQLDGKVAHYKMVSKVIFLDEIPKSPSGKVLRKVLRESFMGNQVGD